MAAKQFVTSAVAVAALAVIVTAGMLANSPRVQARNDGEDLLKTAQNAHWRYERCCSEM